MKSGMKSCGGLRRGAVVLAALGIALAGGIASAQTSRFQRAYGTQGVEIGYDASDTRDGGWVTAGAIGSAATLSRDMLVGRFNEFGGTVWSTIYGSQANDIAYSVQPVRNGGGFIVAFETDAIDAAGLGIGLARLDASGNVVWAWVYPGTPFQDFPAGVVVRETENGFVVVGRIRSPFFPGGLDGVLIRTDLAGAPMFTRIYRLVSPIETFMLNFTDIRQDRDEFVISGYAAFGPQSPTDALILRVNALGVPVSTALYNLAAAPTIVSLTADSLDLSPGGKIAWSGRMAAQGGPGAAMDTIVARVDPAGPPQWARVIRQWIPGFDGVRHSEREQFLVVGTANPAIDFTSASLLKFDALGNLRDGALYNSFLSPNATTGHGVDVTRCNRGYLLTGSTDIQQTNGGQDEYLVKTDLGLSSGCLEMRYGDPQPLDLDMRRPIIESLLIQGRAPFPGVQQDRDVGNRIYCLDRGCVADVDDGSGTGTPDGGVTIDDLLYYLSIFEAGSPCADVDDGSGTGSPDGGVTIDDLLYFLLRFEAGC